MKLVLPLLFLAGFVPQEGTAKGGIFVWDTGKASPVPFNLEARDGWTPLSDPAAFKGDAVVANGRITVVFRRESGAVEMGRVRFLLAGATRLIRAKLIENAKTGAALEATWRTDKGEATAKFRVKRGEVAVEVAPGAGASKLRVECPSRYVVLPDFFSDDIVIDAAKIAPATADLPSENFLLHLAGKGEAIAMCVFENRDCDVKCTLSGSGDARRFTGSEIEFGKEKRIWVALLEAPQVWHAAEAQAGVTKLDWKMPCRAQWRVNFTRADDLTDTWDMLLQKEERGDYVKPSWIGAAERLKPDRRRWTTVLGNFQYPCWSDSQGSAWVQPIENDALKFRGPLVIYPANRVTETPLDFHTVLDIARNSLGVGPCQYILDLEGQKSEYKGRATCSASDLLSEIYSKGEQKARRKEVEQCLDDALVFVKHIRGRITRYVDFMRQMRAYLAAQTKAHPELKDAIAQLAKIGREADERYKAREEKIKTPEHVARMNEDFRKNVLEYEGSGALDRCKQYAEALVEIGSDQDHLSGELRWVVRAFRQKAGLLFAADPRMAPVSGEIRAKTQEALRNPASHEAARH